MHINLHLDYVPQKDEWYVWNCNNSSEFFVKFDCRTAALDFMVKLIAEVKK